MPVIAHLDMDAFFVSCELLRRPELEDKAVVVAGSGKRAVVSTANYHARRFGIGSAMPLSKALRLCPDLVVLPVDMEYYRGLSEQVMQLLKAVSGKIQKMSLDEAYMDLSDVEKPVEEMQRLREDVLWQTGLTCSVGIGPSKMVAKIASDLEKPDALVVLDEISAFWRVKDKSPRLIPGIGPQTAERLANMGITTIEALRAAQPERLDLVFGERLGRLLHERASMRDDSALETDKAIRSRSAETTFDEDEDDSEILETALLQLIEGLVEKTSANGLRATTVTVKMRFADWTMITRSHSFAERTDDISQLTKTAVRLFREHRGEKPLRLIGVKLSGFDKPDKIVPAQMKLL